MVYYGRRYYSPSQGRFVGRDPIEEKGGLHLYGFCGNNGMNRWDYLGMDVQYMDGNGMSFSDGGFKGMSMSDRLRLMSTPTEGYNSPSEDDELAASRVIGTVQITQSDGSVINIQVTQGMASSTDSISSLSSMGTVTIVPGAVGGVAIGQTTIEDAAGRMVPLGSAAGSDFAAVNQTSGTSGGGLTDITAAGFGAGYDSAHRPVNNDWAAIQAAAGRQPGFGSSSANVVLLGGVAAVAPAAMMLAAPSAATIATVQTVTRPVSLAVKVGVAAWAGGPGGTVANNVVRLGQQTWFQARQTVTAILSTPRPPTPISGPPTPGGGG